MFLNVFVFLCLYESVFLFSPLRLEPTGSIEKREQSHLSLFEIHASIMFQTTRAFLNTRNTTTPQLQQGGQRSRQTNVRTPMELLQPSIRAFENIRLLHQIFEGGNTAIKPITNKKKRLFPGPRKNMGWVIYGREGCPCCVDAITFLQRYNIPFKYHTIEQLTKQHYVNNKEDLLAKLTPKRIGTHSTFPIIFYNGDFIGGWIDLAIWIRNNKEEWKKQVILYNTPPSS